MVTPEIFTRRPLVDTLTGSKIANLKELRPRQTMI
jgi:hypothetical protein